MGSDLPAQRRRVDRASDEEAAHAASSSEVLNGALAALTLEPAPLSQIHCCHARATARPCEVLHGLHLLPPAVLRPLSPPLCESDSSPESLAASRFAPAPWRCRFAPAPPAVSCATAAFGIACQPQSRPRPRPRPCSYILHATARLYTGLRHCRNVHTVHDWQVNIGR